MKLSAKRNYNNLKNILMRMCADHYRLVYLRILVSTNGNDEANQLCFGSQSVGRRSTDTCGPISQFAWKQKYNLQCIFYIPTN